MHHIYLYIVHLVLHKLVLLKDSLYIIYLFINVKHLLARVRMVLQISTFTNFMLTRTLIGPIIICLFCIVAQELD